jgi:hypothetical protein
MIRYIVPPSEADAFLEVWKDTADQVQKEEAASIYSLRKVR